MMLWCWCLHCFTCFNKRQTYRTISDNNNHISSHLTVRIRTFCLLTSSAWITGLSKSPWHYSEENREDICLGRSWSIMKSDTSEQSENQSKTWMITMITWWDHSMDHTNDHNHKRIQKNESNPKWWMENNGFWWRHEIRYTPKYHKQNIQAKKKCKKILELQDIP